MISIKLQFELEKRIEATKIAISEIPVQYQGCAEAVVLINQLTILKTLHASNEVHLDVSFPAQKVNTDALNCKGFENEKEKNNESM